MPRRPNGHNKRAVGRLRDQLDVQVLKKAKRDQDALGLFDLAAVGPTPSLLDFLQQIVVLMGIAQGSFRTVLKKSEPRE